MSRYLTPSKLILLLLTRLYSRGYIPWQSRSSVLAYLASHVLPASPENCNEIDEMLELGGGMFVNLDHVEELLKAGQGEDDNDDGDDEMGHETDDEGKLWRLFIEELWKLNSVDALHEFFISLGRILIKDQTPLTPAEQLENMFDEEEDDEEERKNEVAAAEEEGREIVRFTRNSPLGIFVRRSQLEFTRLPFHDTLQLWHNFVRFRAPTEKYWRSLNPDQPPLAFDVSLDDLQLTQADELYTVVYGRLGDGDEEDGKMSTNEIEKLLELQVEKLERQGTRISEEMKAMFRRLIGERATVPSLGHYVKFFDAWKAGDYSSAFDNLHRYFDFTMQSRDRTFYQYALLHLASLHADFGCFPEALSTMAETIATARENGDLHCLNFCLTWLNDLVRSHPEEVRKAGYRNGPLGSEKQGLAFLKAKAREGKTWSLLISVLLSEARVVLTAGESPAKAVELLYQSSHLALNHQNHASYGALWLLHSAMYARLGLSQLSDDYIDALTDGYEPYVPADELTRAACCRAFALSRAGAYSAALALLTPLPPPSRSLRIHQYAATAVRLILLQRALFRMDLRSASALLQKLKSTTDIPTEMRFELSYLELDYHVRSGAIDVAFDQLAVLAEKSAPAFPDDPCAADVADRTRLLVLKARLFALAGQAERGLSVARRAAVVAAKTRCMSVLWGAVAALAEILNRTGQFEGARALVDAVLPSAIEGGIAGGIGGIGSLYDILGDSWVGEAGLVGRTPSSSSSSSSDLLFAQSQSHVQTTASSQSQVAQLREPLLSRAETAFCRAEECCVRAQDVWGRIRVLQKRVVLAELKDDPAEAARLRDGIRSCVEIAGVSDLDGGSAGAGGLGGDGDGGWAGGVGNVNGYVSSAGWDEWEVGPALGIGGGMSVGGR